MTWDSSKGNRVLAGHEAILICEAIDRLADELIEELEWGHLKFVTVTGARIFDELMTHEKIDILLTVAKHLLLPTPETLELTAENESTAYAIYKVIEQEIAMEIDFEQDDFGEDEFEFSTWRTLAWNAWIESTGCGSEGDAEAESFHSFPLDEQCTDHDKWSLIVECLADRILWDRDFEICDTFLDAKPEASQLKKQLLGIDDDYFTAVAPEPKLGKQLDTIDAIRQLVRQKPR